MKTSFSFQLMFMLLFACSVSFAQLNVSPIFGSDMVLQRNTTVPIFGTTSPGASVTVQFLGQNKSVTADGTGNWQVNLSSMATNASMNSMTVSSAGDNVTFTGVQVGEVWLCSGQSNMGWSMSKADDSAPAIADAGNHNIRLFRMTAGNGPSTTTWKVSNSTTVTDFSAVGYWMGLELSQWFGNVPIGLIQATHDGTAIDQWQHTSGGQGTDYDAMVKPIQPYAIKGVAWYQGESNGGDSDYDVKLTNMINEWRSDWGLPNLHFGIDQLAGTSRSGGARLGQFIVSQTVPNTFLVVIADLPGGNQLHPTTKKPVGLRTAIGARGAVYGDNIPYSGPVIDVANSSANGNVVTLQWDFVDNGFITSDGQAPSTFQVASAGGQFKSATAVIVGNTIELSSSTVPNPALVRYQFGSVGNLFNSVNIPVEGGASAVTMLPTSMFELVIGEGPSNNPPTASYLFNSNLLAVDFDGSASSDSDGTITDWSWDFGDGNTASGELVSHTYGSSGNYTVVLTVMDDAGATHFDSQIVSVSDGNNPPLASFSFSTNVLDVAFDASSSSDSDGTISSWNWNFGDGTTGSGVNVSHTYAFSGTYSVTLTVTDDGGAIDTDVKSVTVSDGSSGGNIHVNSIITFTQSAGKGSKLGVARVTINDDQESPVAGVSVTVTFFGDYNETVTGTTVSDGTVELTTVDTASGGVTVNLCVDDVSHSSLTYNPSENDITCTGSGARFATELNVQNNLSDVALFPNPVTNGQFKIGLPDHFIDMGDLEIAIYALEGRRVFHDLHGASQESTININIQLEPGVYVLRLNGKSVKSVRQLIIR